MIEKSIDSTRPSWDDYFHGLADTTSKRSTCNRGRSGCVIVRDRQVLATGYAGSPTGLPHCDDVGHLLKKLLKRMGRLPNIVCGRSILNRTQYARPRKGASPFKALQHTLE